MTTTHPTRNAPATTSISARGGAAAPRSLPWSVLWGFAATTAASAGLAAGATSPSAPSASVGAVQSATTPAEVIDSAPRSELAPHPAFRHWAPDLTALRAAAVAGSVMVEGVPLDGDLVDFLAWPMQVSLPVVVAAEFDGDRVVERPLPGPDVLLLEGHAVEDPTRKLFLAIEPAGRERGDRIEGFVAQSDRTYLISSGGVGMRGPTLVYRPGATPAELLEILIPTCEAEALAGYAEAAAEAGALGGGVAGAASCRAIELAVETDHEYLANLFGGDTQAATNYVATIFGAVSSIYQAQVSARVEVVFVRLWVSPFDPWNQNTTSAQLSQFRDVWNAAMQGLPRDLAHFLSGRQLGGGVAWLNAICSDGFGYGLSANLNGFFPYPIVDNSYQNWDLMVVAHELGHNFGSPHTHNYSPPLDGCGLGNCQQAFGGTIMSYCHQCPGGLSNMVMSFHPSNVETMLAFLAGIPCAAGGAPGSLTPDSAVAGAGLPKRIDVLANDFSGDCSAPLLAGHAPASAAGGALAISLGTGPDGRDEMLYTAPAGHAGADAFVYSAQLAGGATLETSVSVEVLPLRAPDGPSAATPGLLTSYYALAAPSVLPDFSQLVPIAAEVVPLIDFPSTNGPFAGSGLADDVGAVFMGWLEAPVDALYELFLESDDGSRLFIGDAMVVDNDGLHAMVERSGMIGLAAGRHALRIEFFERGGGAGVIARWKREGVSKSIIPAMRLSHTATADLDGSGIVDGADLGILLGAWGSAGPGDLDGNGVVDGGDLGILLAAWSS
ncbi:MAG TPA: M12 family metallo-peptidase [Phycisphaerales bacterium]|nr:M12 family metallo-peptidase [Phycisphaerales bacterium]HMP38302.1 M12 family metallo-peptidase [Phycisphaerales bacterium]